ncbi:hypothetical protein [Holophaga foetida]|uniref:hypothetical protein n=1 Tax=Holophaga foetida TaxID=35839 RepID=UPI000247505B|nr:hypothetical protein [Holophaga foetida]
MELLAFLLRGPATRRHPRRGAASFNPHPISTRTGAVFLSGIAVGCVLVLVSLYAIAPMPVVLSLGAIGGVICIFLLRLLA